MCVYLCKHIYVICIYAYVYIYVNIYLCIYVQRESEKKRENFAKAAWKENYSCCIFLSQVEKCLQVLFFHLPDLSRLPDFQKVFIRRLIA